MYFAAGARLPGLIPIAYSALALANTALFSFTRNLRFYRVSQLLLILLLPWVLMMSLGGIADSSAVIAWSALCPLGALLFEERKNAFGWMLGFLALLAVGAVVQPYLAPGAISGTLATWLIVFNIGGVIGIAFAMLVYFVGQRDFFQERAETLLLNVLPKEISDTLKGDKNTIAAHHSAASILFADVVEFTPISTTMSPMQLVGLLNEVFQCFDDLVEKYDLEKIKTIGDCYMVAAGVPCAREDHAKALVDLALDLRSAVAERSFGGKRLSFRIGINSGPVVAGVIGRKKFIYDLWGDAVNVASRMESHGVSGEIQITRNTFDLVKDDFVCEPQGMVQIKGAGEIEAWHVVDRHLAS